ncbi:MAG: chloride channel protein [Gammaproteobacteria bacterium]|nr:chloride channel protein [Gammaproteobacteria bacterium]MBL6999785.1 chloride channel protein [Gammaproteobacteria bacterium]
MSTLYEFVFFGLVEVLCGFIAIGFNHALPKGVALGAKLKIDNRLKPMLGGLILAGLGFYFLAILAILAILGLGGYMTTAAISGSVALQMCLILLVLKFIATIVSFSFGFNGGVFGPALFMGAMTGAAVGLMAESVAPVFLSTRSPVWEPWWPVSLVRSWWRSSA